MADVSQIKLPNGDVFDLVDKKSGYITGMVMLSYGISTWNDFITAYNANKVVYCRASSNANPASGSQTRLAFMAYVSNASAPTSVEFQYYRSVNGHTDAQQGDQVYIYKLTSAGVWSVTTRESYSKIAVSGDLTKNYSNGTITISATIPTIPTTVSSFTNDAGYVITGAESSNSTTGISIADHATATIYGVSSSTTTVIGVQSNTTAVRGVKTGTNSTTTASKVVLGNAITIPSFSASDVTIPIRADADTIVPTAATGATTVPIKNETATVVPIVAASATACDDITRWQAGSGDLVFTMDTTDTKKLIISHSHVAPNLEYTGHFVTGVDGTTSIYGVQSTTTSVTGINGNTTIRGVKTGNNSTVSASKVTFNSDINIPNVTSVTDVTVPIRADSDTTVPIKNTSTTTVPIKDTNSTTVVTGKTHTITDIGHTHTV